MHLDAPTPPLAPPPRDAASIKGVERLASVAGGGLLISRGLARGGLLGLLTGEGGIDPGTRDVLLGVQRAAIQASVGDGWRGPTAGVASRALSVAWVSERR